jgi:hypothetical protein
MFLNKCDSIRLIASQYKTTEDKLWDSKRLTDTLMIVNIKRKKKYHIQTSPL